MNHRFVAVLIPLLALLFGGAALLFAVGVRGPGPGRPAAVPHGLTGDHAQCGACHAPGGGAPPEPATHRSFQPPACTLCHVPS